MTQKHFFMILSILLIGSGAFLFFWSSDILPSGDKLKPRSDGFPISVLDKASRVALHPLAADWKTVEAAEKQRVISFDDWARKTVEIGLALDVLYGIINTPEELASLREERLAIQTEWAADIKAQGCSLPNYPYEWPKLPPKKLFDYDGPQTSEALIAEYDERWLNTSPPRYADYDVDYPKAAWIDRIISMGGKFQEMRDYDFYLKLRGTLINHKSKPDKWRSGAFGIAKSAYEKFAGRMRQLESFATMSDAEIEKQLERQFRKQFLPEHPVEQLEQITPERLERALGTLFKYGFEDGMRHIREDNAALADQLERHFGKRAKPPAQELKPPQRPAPPKPPSEPPASSDETQ